MGTRAQHEVKCLVPSTYATPPRMGLPCLIEGSDYAWAGSMSLLTVVFVIIVVGILLWVVNRFIPMDSKIRSILNAVVVIVLVFWLLDVFGIIDSLRGIRV
jgi:hypothetical protein